MSSATMYSEATGRIINAYVESACARAVAVATRTTYDQEAHARAASAFDRLIARLDEADDLLTLLDDWFSGGHEIVIASSKSPEGYRVDKEGTRDRLWVNEFEGDGWTYETVRDALREYARDADCAPVPRNPE